MDGQIIVLSSTGTMVTQVVVLQGTEIISLTWSCEKFNMDESSTEQNENFTAPTGKISVIQGLYCKFLIKGEIFQNICIKYHSSQILKFHFHIFFSKTC